MEVFNDLLKYFGYTQYILPLLLGVNLFSLITIVICRFTGPSALLATLNFLAPIILALGMSILVFFSSTFWLTWLLYFILWGLSSALSFHAVYQSLDDKTGVGAVMATGFLGMFCLGGAILVKGILVAYTLIFS